MYGFHKKKFDQVLIYIFNNPNSEDSLELIADFNITKFECVRITYLLFIGGFINATAFPSLTNKGEMYVKKLSEGIKLA
ncbi:hypothetical protein ABIB50_003855 [Mucilaginibacter sp. UYCu711]